MPIYGSINDAVSGVSGRNTGLSVKLVYLRDHYRLWSSLHGSVTVRCCIVSSILIAIVPWNERQNHMLDTLIVWKYIQLFRQMECCFTKKGNRIRA